MGVGWAVGELPGAVIAGVLVWGLRQAEGANSKRAIAASARAAKSSAANQFGAVPAHSELDALRREVSDLSLRLESTERRLAALDGGQAALAPAPREESMEPELAAVTEAQAPAPLPVSEPPLAPATAEADRAADRPAQAQVRTPEPDMPVGPLDELGELVSRLTGGNTVVRVGVIVLLLGIGFLLKYAADQGVFPVEVRLVGAFALGSALVALGWKLRIGRHGYGVSLQGGGLGIIYLVTIAAFRLYGLIPAPVAFALLVSTVALEGVLALAQEALALAILATLSGFAAPILLSTGGGAHVVMFGWYAVLNAGVLAMAW
ncbi:MAG: putative membrane protein, partial [Myxococcota bacterium]